jgi:ribonuclease T1
MYLQAHSHLSPHRQRHAWGIRVLMGLVLTMCTFLVHARSATDTGTQPVIALKELPREARKTYRLILAGGPFPYEKDGTVFGNRERLLPRKARGFYREYTVRTPGLSHRGARRIVCGGEIPRQPDACYYTADHYASFRMIVETN